MRWLDRTVPINLWFKFLVQLTILRSFLGFRLRFLLISLLNVDFDTVLCSRAENVSNFLEADSIFGPVIFCFLFFNSYSAPSHIVPSVYNPTF